MKIRKAVKSDISKILEVHKQSWMETYVPHAVTVKEVDSVFSNRNKKISQWKKSLSDSDKFIRVVDISNEVVGFSIAERSPKQNRLSAIYILKKFQRKELGRSLWKTILSEDFWNDNPIVVEVGVINKSAQLFYKNLGFVFLKKLKPHIFCEGSSMDCIEMIKN